MTDSPIHIYLREVGVSYRHPKDDEERAIGEVEFRYTWEHLTEGASGTRRIFILGTANDLYRLLGHWNRLPDWKYYLDF